MMLALTPGLRYATVPAVSAVSASAPWSALLRVMFTCNCGTIFGSGLVAQAKAHGGQIAGPVVLPGLVEFFHHRRLELAVDKGVEILAHRLVVVRTDDKVGAAGAGLQAGVEGIVPMFARRA